MTAARRQWTKHSTARVFYRLLRHPTETAAPVDAGDFG